MQTITTIGLDIAKSVFQVHGVVALLVARTPGAWPGDVGLKGSKNPKAAVTRSADQDLGK
jgi:hypothetical protein